MHDESIQWLDSARLLDYSLDDNGNIFLSLNYNSRILGKEDRDFLYFPYVRRGKAVYLKNFSSFLYKLLKEIRRGQPLKLRKIYLNVNFDLLFHLIKGKDFSIFSEFTKLEKVFLFSSLEGLSLWRKEITEEELSFAFLSENSVLILSGFNAPLVYTLHTLFADKVSLFREKYWSDLHLFLSSFPKEQFSSMVDLSLQSLHIEMKRILIGFSGKTMFLVDSPWEIPPPFFHTNIQFSSRISKFFLRMGKNKNFDIYFKDSFTRNYYLSLYEWMQNQGIKVNILQM